MPDVSGFHPTLGRSHIAQLQNQIQDRPQMQAHVGHLMQSHHGSIGNQAQMGMQSQLSVHQNHLSPHQSDDMMHHVNHVMGESDPGVQLQDGDNGDPLIGDDEVSGEIKVIEFFFSSSSIFDQLFLILFFFFQRLERKKI